MIPRAHRLEVAEHCEKTSLLNQNKTEDGENCDLHQI